MMYKSVLSRISAGLILLLLISCDLGQEKSNVAIQIDQAFATWAEGNNKLIEYYRPGFASELYQARREMPSVSPENILEGYDRALLALQQIQSIDTTSLNPYEKLEWIGLRDFLHIQAEGKEFAFYESLINPIDGIHFSLFQDLGYGFTMEEKDDCDRMITRARTYPKLIDDLKAYLNACNRAKTLPPKALLIEVKKQADSLLATPVLKHPLYRGLARQLGNADPILINEREATSYLIKMDGVLQDYVYPPYKELVNMLDVLIDNAEDDISVNRWSNGQKFYEYQLKKYLGHEVELTALHEEALQEFDELKNQFAMEGLAPSEKLLPASSRFKARNASLDSARALSRRMRRDSQGLMDSIPQTKLYILEMPDWAGDYTPTHAYYPPAMDGSRRGIMLIDMTHPEYHGIFSQRVQLYQFGNPGMHYFVSSNFDRKSNSDFSKYVNFEGNVMGWKVMVADQVYQSLGLLQERKTSKAEYEQQKILSLGRLIIDTGIHLEGWSREQAISFLIKEIGLSERLAKLETDRAIVYPGRPASEWLGYRELQKLKNGYRRIKDKNFQLQDFHNMVMMTSSSPFRQTFRRLKELTGESLAN
ncbi:MAG: DUF885 family protein [Bacteroidota bacterium]